MESCTDGGGVHLWDNLVFVVEHISSECFIRTYAVLANYQLPKIINHRRQEGTQKLRKVRLIRRYLTRSVRARRAQAINVVRQ